MTTRREVLATSVALGALGMFGRRSMAQGGMNILILGGTGFIGPTLVQHALDRGHSLTLFNRGRTNTHLFPEVEKLVGDRNNDLSALELEVLCAGVRVFCLGETVAVPLFKHLRERCTVPVARAALGHE